MSGYTTLFITSFQLSYSNSQLWPPPLCRWYTYLPFLGYPGYKVLLYQLMDCLHDIFHWMTDSNWKLNANKAEFLLLVHKDRKGNLIDFPPTRMLSQTVTPTVSALNLWVTFDNNKNFRQHISQSCRCWFYHIRDVLHIRRYMCFVVAKTNATALVGIRLDHASNQHIYIHCSLLLDSPGSFDHHILIYFLFPMLSEKSKLELFQLLHRLYGIHSLLVLSRKPCSQTCGVLKFV